MFYFIKTDSEHPGFVENYFKIFKILLYNMQYWQTLVLLGAQCQLLPWYSTSTKSYLLPSSNFLQFIVMFYFNIKTPLHKSTQLIPVGHIQKTGK